MGDLTRQGLLVWLRKVVEEGKCHGVVWEDEEEQTFRIPWGNQKSRGWKEEDCSVFLEYAKYTGKYRVGEKRDFPRWKQNLKSAINKNRFIERLRNRDRLGGTKPFRVYKFTDNEGSKRNGKGGNDANCWLLNGDADNGPKDLQQRYEERINGRTVSCSSTSSFPESSSSTSLDSRSETKSASPSSSPGVDFLRLLPSPLGHNRDEVSEPQYSGNIPTIVEEMPENLGISKAEPGVVVPDSTEPITSPTTTVIMPFPVQIVTLGPEAYQASPTATGEVTCSAAYIFSPSTQSQASSFSTVLSSAMALGQQTQAQSLAFSGNITTDISSMGVNVSQCNFQIHSENNNHISSMSHPRGQTPPQLVTTWAGGHNLAQPPMSNFQMPISATVEPFLQATHGSFNQGCMSTQSTAPLSVTNDIEMQVPFANSVSNCTAETQEFSSMSMDPASPQSYPCSSEFSLQQFTTYRENDNVRGASSGTQNSQRPDAADSKNSPYLLQLQILYGTPHKVVMTKQITNPAIKIYYGIEFLSKDLDDSPDTFYVELPKVDAFQLKDDKKAKINNILKNMTCGVVIKYRDDDIYVERKCLPHVFLSDGREESKPLPRSSRKRPNVETKAFDFQQFTSLMECHKQNPENKIPRDHFMLTFGHEILPNDDSPTRSVPIYAVVRHYLASKERYTVLGDSSVSSNTLTSDPDSYDKFVEAVNTRFETVALTNA